MIRRISFCACIVFLTAAVAWTQSKTGTTVGQFLLIEPSARIAGMGNAGVTVGGGIQAAYYNPAAIGLVDGSGLEVTHSPWLADITYDYVGGTLNLGTFGTLFGSVTSLNSGEIDVRTVAQPLGTGERYSVTDLAFGLGYGRKVSDRFSIGIQGMFLQETIWHSSMSAFALNIGTLYRISEEGLRIGASLSNWGTRAKFDGRDLRILYDQNTAAHGDNPALPAALYTDDFPLPIMFRVGVGLPIVLDDDNRFFVAADAYHPSDNTESVSVGGEYTFMNMFSIRAGYQNIFLQDSEVGLTLGAGVQYAMNDLRVYFDYGWADHGRLDKTQRLTLGILF
jgi:long-subunit fatty acid transport protein